MTRRFVGDGPWLRRNTSKCLITSVLGGKTKLAGDLSCLVARGLLALLHTTPTYCYSPTLASPLYPACDMSGTHRHHCLLLLTSRQSYPRRGGVSFVAALATLTYHYSFNETRCRILTDVECTSMYCSTVVKHLVFPWIGVKLSCKL